MALTLAALRRRIASRIGRESINESLNVKLNDMINDARNQFIGYGPWHFLAKTAVIPIVATTQEYTLAADMSHLNEQEVRRTNTFKRMFFLDDNKFEFLVSTPAATGLPLHFRTVGYQKIQFYPIPDANAVTVEASFTYEYYQRLTTALSGDSDVSGLPEYVEPCVLDLAEVYAQDWAGRMDKSQAAFQRFLAAIQKLWQDNSDLLRVQGRDIPPALRIGSYEQVTKVDRS